MLIRDRVYKVYYLTNTIYLDYIFYIGITSKSLDDRLKGHLREPLYRGATRKNNWIRNTISNKGRIRIKLLNDNLNINEATTLEKEYIKMFNNLGFSLTNSTEGGEVFNYNHNTPESIYKRTRHAVGKQYSKGFKHTPEHKERMRILNTGKKMSPEAIEKTIEGKRKKVVQLSLTGEYINTYISLSEAGRQVKTSKDNIICCCKGTRHTAGKFKWRYEENYLLELNA